MQYRNGGIIYFYFAFERLNHGKLKDQMALNKQFSNFCEM